ncbi:hypothetical protein PCK2_000434 [Pneumocystis canis]|nr:hypothetical protein PCK2_000434 [Pneumocystis canis]
MKSSPECQKTPLKDEKCPICRNDPYLNPNMRFLINPECYHKMCESCVARIFTLGPSPCPKCGKILRKGRFREQTFEDTNVEREIDIRKRISKTFLKPLLENKTIRGGGFNINDVYRRVLFEAFAGLNLGNSKSEMNPSS